MEEETNANESEETEESGESRSLGPCPKCEGQIVEKEKFYGCSRWSPDGGCDFRIWREFLYAQITPEDVTALLAGEQAQARKMHGKREKEFSAPIRFNKETLKLEPVFEPRDESNFGKCPLCGEGTIRNYPKSFGCSAYKDGCKFAIWKEQMRGDSKISEADITRLLAGQPSTPKKLKSTKERGTFYQSLEEGVWKGRLQMVFDSNRKSEET